MWIKIVMQHGILLFILLIFTFLNIAYFPTTIVATEPPYDPFLKDRSPKLNIPNLHQNGDTSNSPSPTSDASLDHQKNVMTEVSTKITTVVYSTVYGIKPTNKGKPSMGEKSSGCKGVRNGGGKEGLGILASAIVGMIIIFLKQLNIEAGNQ
ncbi:15926_t:CDS:1 [Acaulospora colombiana]|uniref:15926_t:CDS:1 n=1 Tax=Acaulospora colombiana TaxID=27376 RepID=A0ACA9LI16_9GLOM|nr:15926_t:CDS:1 [Acaulospora colombiana]